MAVFWSTGCISCQASILVFVWLLVLLAWCTRQSQAGRFVCPTLKSSHNTYWSKDDVRQSEHRSIKCPYSRAFLGGLEDIQLQILPGNNSVDIQMNTASAQLLLIASQLLHTRPDRVTLSLSLPWRILPQLPPPPLGTVGAYSIPPARSYRSVTISNARRS